MSVHSPRPTTDQKFPLTNPANPWAMYRMRRTTPAAVSAPTSALVGRARPFPRPAARPLPLVHAVPRSVPTRSAPAVAVPVRAVGAVLPTGSVARVPSRVAAPVPAPVPTPAPRTIVRLTDASPMTTFLERMPGFTLPCEVVNAAAHDKVVRYGGRVQMLTPGEKAAFAIS